MVIQTYVKLDTPILGELKQDSTGVRRFKKIQGNIYINQFHWKEQLGVSMKMLKLTTDSNTILPEASYVCPTIILYRRTYSKMHVELFEACRKGCQLTWQFCIRDDLAHAPTLEQFADVFALTGKYLGLSQFGSKFGFGKFSVITINEINGNNRNSAAEKNQVDMDKQ